MLVVAMSAAATAVSAPLLMSGKLGPVSHLSADLAAVAFVVGTSVATFVMTVIDE